MNVLFTGPGTWTPQDLCNFYFNGICTKDMQLAVPWKKPNKN